MKTTSIHTYPHIHTESLSNAKKQQQQQQQQISK